MNISLEAQLREESALAAMLRNRTLILAQQLVELTSERDQLRAELEAARAAAPQEVNNGAAE
ncbi:hypothetical protein [Rhizobium sp. LCM 4573]|uniref:hypothetical protein n=1 Tax=Rhizobium sp. LCM 4573 TaxID=1848291 RepID=UPI0008D9D12B|nr:hypothetical protein [Rhizobium sp. LCM 4573]OHV84147.1 hypothetical protein LCM4573_00075 [Rhizobium sp. LCM 4573]